MKPILFNTEMVRAILDGRKTVTRRVVKPQHSRYADGSKDDFENIERDARFPFLGVAKNHPNMKTVLVPPCVPSDILYVRETWATTEDGHDYLYRADANPAAGGFIRDKAGKLHAPRWRPSIHMPKEAARIFLRVTDVRVERLQQIMDDPPGPNNQIVREGCKYGCDFIALWDRTIKPTDREVYGWDANPWVWVIEFERCEKPKEET